MNPTVERHDLHDDVPDEEIQDQGDLVAIRRNLLLSGVVGGLAGLLGAAFLARGSGPLDLLLALVMFAIAGLHLIGLISSRVPVLVADDQGIRLRIGMAWRGLPWASIRQIVIERPDTPLREGRLVVVPRDLTIIGHGLDPLATAHLRWNKLWYGAGLSIPLGMSTFTDSPELAADLRALAQGRVDIADLRGKQLAQLDEVPVRAREVEPPPAEDGAVELLDASTLPGGMEPALPAPPLQPGDPAGETVVVEAPAGELPPPPEDDVTEEIQLPPPVAPLRDLRQPMRVEVRLPHREPEPLTELAHEPEPMAEPENSAVFIPGQRRAGEIAELLAGGDLHQDLHDEKDQSAGPLIGAKIVHAREMLDMSIDELSQRTRIRPHVLEAMERDDFGPCGGDVYARGHLTSVARILGLTLEPLMEIYEERYAQGPINARRVFEADLSTGLSGGMRATLGGPRWSLLISAVLCLTMVWGLARLFAGDGEHLSTAPDPGSQVAGLAGNHEPITSPLTRTSTITVTARFAATHLVVRDRSGRVLWSGDLAIGRKRTIAGVAPFKVTADNAGAVEVSQKGKSLGTVGMAGAQGSKKFG
jgi:cytoskeleton protein RodZ